MKKVVLEDILKYRFPENIQVSPEGGTAAFQVAYADTEKNGYKRDVWVIRDEKATQLTATLNANIVLWDDESTLVLRRTTDDKGLTELFKMNINGGEAMPWLQLPIALGSMKKVGEDHYVASVSIDMNDPDAYKDDADTRKQKAEDKKKDADYEVVDEIPYWFNGRGFTNGKRTALFDIKTNPLEMTRVTAPAFDMGGFTVEGNTVYFTGSEHTINNDRFSGLYSYDLCTKEVTEIYPKKDLGIRGVFVLDGKVYVQSSDMKDYGINQTPCVSVVEDGQIKPLFKPEVQLHDTTGSDVMLGGGKNDMVKNNVWYTLATVEDHTALFAYDKDMNKTVVFEEPGKLAFFDTDGKKIYCVRVTAAHPAEVYVMNMDGTDAHVVTHLNDEFVEDTYVALPNRVDYTSAGDELHGWVLLPENFDPEKKYPAVLDVHGGPRTVYGEIFFHEMQAWANLGYVVFFTNMRGSDGRGDDFADIRGKYGTVDFDALMDFTDAVLKAYPNIDTTKVCETGGSYGGFMTNWIIGHTDRFCCTASQRSIANWVSFSFISDIGEYFGPDQCGGNGLFGEENTAHLWDRSPLKYAENVKTPTLFIHSDEDYRCPLPEGMQMMQALAARGVETRLVIFHGENHELSRGGKPLHRMRRLNEITGWFEKHTK